MNTFIENKNGATDAEKKRTVFWNLLFEKLLERGKPFDLDVSMRNGFPSHYAQIKKGVGCSLDLAFSCRNRFLRVYLYIDNNPTLYSHLYDLKALLEKNLGYDLVFTNAKKRASNVKWIKKEWHFNSNSIIDYERLINETFSSIEKFVETIKKYI